MWCVAVGCTNHKKKNPELSFYKLPSDKKISLEWKAKIKRENLPKIVRVCEKHFEENCFDSHVDLKNRLLPDGKKSYKRIYVLNWKIKVTVNYSAEIFLQISVFHENFYLAQYLHCLIT